METVLYELYFRRGDLPILLIPLLVVTMTKAHLLPERYSKTCFCVQSVQC